MVIFYTMVRTLFAPFSFIFKERFKNYKTEYNGCQSTYEAFQDMENKGIALHLQCFILYTTTTTRQKMKVNYH